MKNYVQHGETLSVTSPSGGVVTGTPYLIGRLFGIALFSAAAGSLFELQIKGVVTAPKATGAAWAEGDVLYWDDTAKKLTKTSSGNKAVAIATTAAASGDTFGNALMVPATT